MSTCWRATSRKAKQPLSKNRFNPAPSFGNYLHFLNPAQKRKPPPYRAAAIFAINLRQS